MTESTHHTARLEPTTKDYIGEVHENHEGYNSIKHFAEQAVANNVGYIEQQVRGAADLRQLIQMLCRVDGISIDLPERTFDTKLREEALTSATKVELRPQQLNSIEKTTRATGLSKGGVVRICLIRELHKLSSFDGILHEPRQSDIQEAWGSIEEDVEMLFSALLSQLETKLVTQVDSTRQKVANDPKARDALRAHYENYFEGSAGYHRLQQSDRGREVLEGLEALPHGEG